MLLWLISEQKSWSAFGSFSPLNGLSPCPPPFMLRCSRLLQCLPVNSWRDLFLPHEMHAFFCSMSQSWPGRAKPFRVSLFSLVWFPLSCQSSSVPVSHAGTQDSLAGLVFPWFCPNWRKLCMFPRPPLCPNYGKTGLYFSHNWHGLCLGQEPKTNYKEWPQPRELEKHLDNTVQKLFPRMRWHLKYVLGLCIFFIALELV